MKTSSGKKMIPSTDKRETGPSEGIVVRAETRTRSRSQSSKASVILAICLLIVSPYLTADCTRAVHYVAPEECQWSTIDGRTSNLGPSDSLVASSMTSGGSGSTNDGEIDGDVSLVCRLRTLNGAFDRTNFSLIQPEHTASLTLRCEDLLFESTLADGSFRHLGRSLRALTLDRCKVGSVPAGAFAGLERLRNLTLRTRNGDWGGSVHALRLHEASLRSVPRLRRLDLSENGARRFPAKLLCGLGELRFVNLSDNTLENAAGLPFGYGIQQGSRQSLPGVATSDMADAKENKNCPLDIERVELARNRLRVLVDRGFASLQRLKTLDLRLNLIARAEEQALAGLRELQVLDLSGNQLVALPPSFFRPCASKLTEIRIANNSVSVLPPGLFSGLENLIVLDASRNELTSHWLSGGDLFADLKSLAVLDLSYNRLTRLDSSTLKALISLQVLQIHHNEIETIADGAFSSLQSLHALSLGHNRLKKLGSASLSGPSMLGSLQLDDNALEEIDEQTFANCCQDQLMELNLSANRLRKVPRALAALQGLRSLDLGENEIEELAMAAGRLNAKEQQSNDASKFGPLQGLQNLYSLRLQGNFLGNLTRGVFRDMPSLRILNLARNRIGAVEQGTFDDVPELHALRLDANSLSDINGLFGNLHDLLMLNVSANRVSWFDYALVPLGLQWLDLHDNRVEGLGNYFELDGALKLRTLDASKNRISEIDSSSLPDGIEIVFLGDNRIENVSPLAFVSKQNLTRVDLSRNKLSTLDMNSLRLSEVPTRRPLPEFSLAGNPFLCDCHLEWLQRLATGALDEARLYPRLVDADKLECRLTFSRGGLLGAITSKELATGSTDEEEDRGVASVSLAKARPSQFLCRYKSHCFALCHCCDFDACDCKMVCPENCACFYDQSWNANVVDCSSRNHSQVPGRVPMDVTELYLDGNDIPTLSSHTFIGRKNLRVLHLNGSGVQTIRNSTFNGLRALEVLQLARNYLVTLQGHEFERLVKLRELDLSRNRLTSLANGTFTSLKSLQLLRLDHNFLSRFELWQLDANLGTLRHLRAAHNPWSCRCSFARRLADWLKARDQHGPPGMVVDTRSFQCLYNASSTAPLFVDPRNTTPGSAILPFCAKDHEEKAETPVEVGVVDNSGGNIISADGTEEIQDDTGSSATSTTTFVERLHSPELVPVLIVLATVVGSLLFILALAVAYRRQVSVWMFAKYGLRLGSSPALASKGGGVVDDDDDEKLFDAFVSYSKKDEAFVSQILAPELECGDPPYRLCLHYRDLPVDNSNGATTPHHLPPRGIPLPSNNASSGTVSEALSEAMESSRRTVIVLSENFLRGEWGHYEFKAAHLEALAQQRTRDEPGRGGKKKRKRNGSESRLLLVIVILGRVARSEVDADLRVWLERHPVLRWGERHFWEKLRYALPDVRRRRRRHPHQQLPPPPRHLNPSPPVPPSFQHHLYQTLNPPPPQASPHQQQRQGTPVGPPQPPAQFQSRPQNAARGIVPPSLPSHHQQYYPQSKSYHPGNQQEVIRQPTPQWHSLQKNERRQDVAVHM